MLSGARSLRASCAPVAAAPSLPAFQASAPPRAPRTASCPPRPLRSQKCFPGNNALRHKVTFTVKQSSSGTRARSWLREAGGTRCCGEHSRRRGALEGRERRSGSDRSAGCAEGACRPQHRVRPASRARIASDTPPRSLSTTGRADPLHRRHPGFGAFVADARDPRAAQKSVDFAYAWRRWRAARQRRRRGGRPIPGAAGSAAAQRRRREAPSGHGVGRCSTCSIFSRF